MKKQIASVVALAGLLAISTVREASAGSHVSIPVTISKLTARGAFGSAHNSADSVQFLECNVIAWPTDRQGNCTARDAAGTTVTCFTTDAPMLEVIRSLDADDYVGFMANSAGRCVYVEVINSSSTEPKR